MKMYLYIMPNKYFMENKPCKEYIVKAAITRNSRSFELYYAQITSKKIGVIIISIIRYVIKNTHI